MCGMGRVLEGVAVESECLNMWYPGDTSGVQVRESEVLTMAWNTCSN